MKIKNLIIFIVIMFYVCPAFSQESGLNRTILALYDSTDPYYKSADYNMVRLNAEMPLNYLGLKVKYYDIAKGVPDEKVMEGVLGIITWYEDSKMPAAADYCKWLASQILSGKKCVILGTIGAYEDVDTGKDTPEEVISKVFNSLGLVYYGDWTDNPFFVELVYKDSKMVEFERTLDNEIKEYMNIKSLNERNTVYLKLKRTDIDNSDSDVVVITPFGGVALAGYDIFIDYFNEKRQWRINPFLFFKKAFGMENSPAFDTTTLFGKRIFYSHIDGDGFRNISEIDDKTLSGELIMTDILEKYDLPITASFITAEIDPAFLGSERLRMIAQRISSLPNIEIGSHSFSHPLDWDRKLTAFIIKGYSRHAMSMKDEDLISESAYGDVGIVSVPWDEYLYEEVVGAVKYENKGIAPKNKKVALYQWTGNCRPPAKAVEFADGLDIANINGGDGRFDRSLPSYTALAPLGREVGGNLQVYTSNANENIYTNEWSGPYFGFVYVIETFKQTEYPTLVDSVPRRVSPINVYYHYYSAEKEKSLEALKKVYDYTLTQDLIPVFASKYSRIVKGFFNAKLRKINDNEWEFTDYGECRTVRLNGVGLYPDIAASQGVVGFNEWEGYTYIHLGEEGYARVKLIDQKPERPYLKEASAVLDDLNVEKEKISFKSRSFGECSYEFMNMEKNTVYTLKVFSKDDPDVLYEKNIKSNSDGLLVAEIPVKGEFNTIIQGAK